MHLPKMVLDLMQWAGNFLKSVSNSRLKISLVTKLLKITKI